MAPSRDISLAIDRMDVVDLHALQVAFRAEHIA